ncbi:MAG: protein translocase SEC61 complex subunit gamma, partial [Thermoplasmatota archaeon]
MTTTAPQEQKTEKPRDSTLVAKAWEAQDKLEARMGHIGRGKYGRVIRMARKPTDEEFRKAAIVSGIGILFIGGVGFAIFVLMSFIPHTRFGSAQESQSWRPLLERAPTSPSHSPF